MDRTSSCQTPPIDSHPQHSRVETLLEQLTPAERASLTAGADMWSTIGIPRVGIPSVRVTDGPNGARGPSLPGEGNDGSTCVPCGSALGATWDPELVGRVGALLGHEARAKGCRVLLAPTVNLHRSPLAGRNFECYSEDPLLAGKLAAAFVRGAQSAGVATTVKHFAGNEAEFERQSINSVIDERTLRELYLVPFELAVREGGSLGVMTAYNRLNGPFCAEHEGLLADTLRGEWGFEGLVMTDWFAAGSTATAARAGLDLEMPGPARFYGSALGAAAEAGDVDPALVDAAARRLLRVFERLGILDETGDAASASAAVDRPEDRALARAAASSACVLLKNDGALPLGPSVGRLAVIGPNAARNQIMGGGSAQVVPFHRTTLLDALRDRVGDRFDVVHARGCTIDKSPPPIGGTRLETPDGAPGVELEFFADLDFGGDVLARMQRPETRGFFLGAPAVGVPAEAFSFRASTRFTPAEGGAHTFTLSQVGRARLLIDGDVVLDGSTETLATGHEFFGLGSVDITAVRELTEGQPVDLVIEYSSRDSVGLSAVKVGCALAGSDDELLEHAVAAAADADAAIVVVGTNADWESEGHDRASLQLPGAQDELVARIAAANPSTVVVVNAGAPVALDWIDAPNAVLQAWFGGQEMADALVDVLVGDVDPGGRLPMTLPVRIEDNPSFGNFPGEYGELRYGEGLFVGYRGYDARGIDPRFCFGHGLSYTTFALTAPTASSSSFTPRDALHLDVEVHNTGERRGCEVVQCYVEPVAPTPVRPLRELKAFAKVALDPGESRTVTLTLDDRAFASWDPVAHGWRVDPGDYDVLVGTSSRALPHALRITIPPSNDGPASLGAVEAPEGRIKG